MIGHEQFTSIYLHRMPVDFRKSIQGLSAIVQDEMELDPFSRLLFVFSNRRRDRVKILYWDRTGFVLWYKVLEKAKFAWPKHLSREVVTITHQQFDWMLDGYQYWKFRPHETLNYRHVS